MGDPESPRYFEPAEVAGLNPRLVSMLDKARGLAGVPFRITSGLRSNSENEAVGGVSDSAHTRGLAVDLACYESRGRLLMLSSLLQVGFRRVGVYNFHLHVDCDETLPQDVLWVGLSH